MSEKQAESQEQMIRRMLRARRIAVVGLSDDPSRASHDVADYMRRRGYEIIPVNPNCPSVFGIRSVASLAEVDGEIELVNVFRQSAFCEQIVRDAITVHAKGVWLQLGIRNHAAAQLANEAGLDFVQDRCIKIDHMRFT